MSTNIPIEATKFFFWLKEKKPILAQRITNRSLAKKDHDDAWALWTELGRPGPEVRAFELPDDPELQGKLYHICACTGACREPDYEGPCKPQKENDAPK